MKLDTRLMRLRRGRITFSQFAADTSKLWRVLAARLLNRWRPGHGVDEVDVEQELLVHAWLFVGRWDPQRGVRLDRYVLFNSIDKARKWLDRQRGRSKQGVSRDPTLGVFDSVERDNPLSYLIDIEELIYGADRAQRLLDSLDERQRIVAEALLTTRSAEAAALRIYEDAERRRELRLGSEQAARRMVRRVAKDVLDTFELEDEP